MIEKIKTENAKFFRLLKNWSELGELEKDLVFSWMIGAGEYLDTEEWFEKLMNEIKSMKGTFL